MVTESGVKLDRENRRGFGLVLSLQGSEGMSDSSRKDLNDEEEAWAHWEIFMGRYGLWLWKNLVGQNELGIVKEIFGHVAGYIRQREKSLTKLPAIEKILTRLDAGVLGRGDMSGIMTLEARWSKALERKGERRRARKEGGNGQWRRTWRGPFLCEYENRGQVCRCEQCKMATIIADCMTWSHGAEPDQHQETLFLWAAGFAERIIWNVTTEGHYG